MLAFPSPSVTLAAEDYGEGKGESGENASSPRGSV